MEAILISRREYVFPQVTDTSNCYHDKIPSTTVDLIDSYDEYKKNPCYVTLPEDIWIQIFLRCWAKSLFLATCVCKDWCKIIKDQSFIHEHLQFQKKLSKNSGHFLLHHDSYVDKEFNYFVFNSESMTNETKSSPTSPSYRNIFHRSRKFSDFSFKIEGPVNGLYCLHNQEGRMVIWNPAANEVGFLPIPQQFLPNDDPLDHCIIGFGTDPLDDENFKVILMCVSYNAVNETPYSMLYTTRTNSWRCLDNCYGLVESLNNTYLNGSYYWMFDGMCCAIVFDMREEAFRTISTPGNGELAWHNDHITLFDTNEKLNEIDIWVMLEESSWIKLKKVCLNGIEGHVVKTLGFWKTENDLLIVIDKFDCHYSSQTSQTLLYNTTTQGFMNIGPRGYSSQFRAFPYYESLVSLSGDIIKYQGDDNASLMNAVCGFFLEGATDNQDATDDDDNYDDVLALIQTFLQRED